MQLHISVKELQELKETINSKFSTEVTKPTEVTKLTSQQEVMNNIFNETWSR